MEKKTLEYYREGYNCTQAVLKAAHEFMELEQDKNSLLKMSMGLGVGMYIGETCGAVTGAIMALGIKYGTTEPNDRENLRKLYKQIKIFETNFKEKNCSLNCKELKTIYKIDCEKVISDTGEFLKKQLKIEN
jgi:C_GCAxxG_C_C family probable redox protein